MKEKTKMQQTAEFGSDWWNDSNDHVELQHAYDEGAVGATSNPVITLNSVKNHPKTWLPVIDKLIASNHTASEDEEQLIFYCQFIMIQKGKKGNFPFRSTLNIIGMPMLCLSRVSI